MNATATIRLEIGNAIPAGNEHETDEYIALWRQLDEFFTQRAFTAAVGRGNGGRHCRVSLDAHALVAALETARSAAETLTGQQIAHVEDPDQAVDAALVFEISCEDGGIEEDESYRIANVFLQTLVMAANITRPGSIQVLDARFSGAGAHRYEAPAFDSAIPYGALKASADFGWPQLRAPAFEDVWSWLEGCEAGATDTAIKPVNKSLFTLLKIAEQRDEHRARPAMLVAYLLEVLLDCRQLDSFTSLTRRIRLVLGSIPDEADRLADLYETRNELFVGSQPVRRPPLICRNRAAVLREQTGQTHSPVDSGMSIALALLQDLVGHGAYRYEFTEKLSRR